MRELYPAVVEIEWEEPEERSSEAEIEAALERLSSFSASCGARLAVRLWRSSSGQRSTWAPESE